MTFFEIKGWCPGALRPMMSGDGLVVRVKPRSGRISNEQARAIASAARTYGSGFIDLSSRANLQLRGIHPENYGALLETLDRHGLIDSDPQTETRRNIAVTPFWRDSGLEETLERALEHALAESGLPLPGKFGFAVDCGDERFLDSVSADVRFEAGANGGLIVRADGADLGVPVVPENAVGVALDLARWFVATGGVSDGRGRMAAHLRRGAALPRELTGSIAPAKAAQRPAPGHVKGGALFAVAFGSMLADALEQLAEQASHLHMTPWRMIFLPSVHSMPAGRGLVTDAADPVLRVEACSGAPWCPQARAQTRPLARALAPLVPAGRSLHVSGCAKGCACAQPSTLTLVATGSGFDLIRNGTASAPPLLTGLSESELAAGLSRYIGGL